ncbi:MAG TPA: hypothetical protein VFZ09_25330 [Archangium sp.]|uniref:hypothetical protein n=1 Tax=Archangium sp. TaxID=1872627 RepID=UPI002E337E05|nr:hypothetical protein [Archangium sp.]HEX5749577.1 hypothetical protein [Archangium sp.]
MHQRSQWTWVARLFMTLGLLVSWVGTPVAKAANIGGAGTIAVYNPAGKEPPVWAKKQYEARLQCMCGGASTEVIAYSDLSWEDARRWADSACFRFCLENKWPHAEPFGVWGVIPVMDQAPLGTVAALAPDLFAAYLPGQETPVAQSKEPVALALQLMSLTNVTAVMLAGPEEFFGQAPQCLAP